MTKHAPYRLGLMLVAFVVGALLASASLPDSAAATEQIPCERDKCSVGGIMCEDAPNQWTGCNERSGLPCETYSCPSQG